MKNTILLLTALLLIFSFTGCNDKEMGIFYSIEEERELEDNNIENDAFIGNLVLFNDDYYAAAGNIYTVNAAENFAAHNTNTSGGKWASDPDFAKDDYLCLSIGVIDSKLYGVFYDKDSSSDPSEFESDLWVKPVDGSWSKYDSEDNSGIPVDLKVEKLITIFNGTDNVGFVQAYTLDSENTRTYAVYSFDGTTFHEVTASSNVTSSHSSEFDVDMDNDSDGSNNEYWVTYDTNLLTLTEADLTTGSFTVQESSDYAGDTVTDDDSLMGIYHSDIFSGLFLSKYDGTVYFRPDATVTTPLVSWTAISDTLASTPGDLIDFTFTGSDDATKNVLLVGTQNGYYEFENISGTDFTDLTFELPSESCKFSTYQTLDLRYAIVNSFMVNEVSSGNMALFALTMNDGLYSNVEYDNEDYRIWNIE